MGQIPQFPPLGQNREFRDNFTLKYFSMLIDSEIKILKIDSKLGVYGQNTPISPFGSKSRIRHNFRVSTCSS